MPAAATFWRTHGLRVTGVDDFKVSVGESLQAIAAASGAIVHAYESSDRVSADNITARSTFFKKADDTGKGTLEHERLAYQRKQAARRHH
jgi:hypothetical protein